MELSYTILEHDNFFNLKEVLKTKFEISDRLLLKLKQNNKILINKNMCSVSSCVYCNDVITVLLDLEEENFNIVPTKMNLDILYEDDWYIILNKPAGIPVHPSLHYYENSLSNGVRYYFDSIGLKKKVRPVNRLDKDTSGVVIFAKNEYIQECLVRQMKNNNFVKEYIAICNGIFDNKCGIINAPIARKSESIIERCVDDNGDFAVTRYSVLQDNGSVSKVLCTLETGRTHQIRVHMSYAGHPIIGDTLYGSASDCISRQALHSYRTCFIHPITRQKVEYIAPIPLDILNIIEKR